MEFITDDWGNGVTFTMARFIPFEDAKDTLIGKNFRRNKYGLSHWVDTVVSTHSTHFGFPTRGFRIDVRGTSGLIYRLDEIVFTDEPKTNINIIAKPII